MLIDKPVLKVVKSKKNIFHSFYFWKLIYESKINKKILFNIYFHILLEKISVLKVKIWTLNQKIF